MEEILKRDPDADDPFARYRGDENRGLTGAEWAAEGVFTLFAILFVFVGAQFIAFGLLGEYIGRIYEAVRERPPYVLAELPEREEAE